MFKPKNILVPTDFSERAEHALLQAIEIAEQFNASLTILHVSTKDTDSMPLFFLDDKKLKEIHDDIDEYIEEQIQGLEKKHIAGKTINYKHIIKHGTPYSDIITYIKENNIDLVIMPSKGRNAIEEFFFGGTTEKVVRRAPCSVLVVR